jgi:hypothetical protein
MDLSVPDRMRIRHGIFFHLQLGHHLRAVEIDIFTHHTGLNIWQRKKKDCLTISWEIKLFQCIPILLQGDKKCR